MRNTSLALCILSVAGFGALALPAQAMPVAPAPIAVEPIAAAPLGLATGAPQAETIAWRRVCRPVVVRWWNGRPVYSNRCNNVWVGPGRGPNYAYGPRPGYGPGPGYGPRPGYYPPPPPPPPPAFGWFGPPRPLLF